MILSTPLYPHTKTAENACQLDKNSYFQPIIGKNWSEEV